MMQRDRVRGCRIQRHRKGTTLIETLVLGVLTALALTSISMLTHGLLKSSRQITDAGQVRHVAARLQSRVWSDSALMASSELASENGVTIWRSTLSGDRKLEYRAMGRNVDRAITGRDGQVEHRDQFRLPPTYRFVAAGDSGRMELRIEQELAPALGQEQNLQSTGLRVLALFSKSDAEAAP